MSMVSTQQAADQLNVSRPYVVKLCEDDVFQGVERTQAGHRRIPAAAVARVQQDMRISRRAALKKADGLTSDLRAQELDTARTNAQPRWTKPAGWPRLPHTPPRTAKRRGWKVCDRTG